MAKGLNIIPNGIANGEKRSSTFSNNFKVGPVSIKFITIIIVAVVALFYLTQVQLESGKKQKISELQKRQEELEKESKRLENEVVRLQSIQEIKKQAETLDMVPATEINYLDDFDAFEVVSRQ